MKKRHEMSVAYRLYEKELKAQEFDMKDNTWKMQAWMEG